MSINEADLVAKRKFTATISFPQSHVTTGQSETLTFVTGPAGPPGPEGKWVAMTQANFDALPVKDPDVLYIIIP